MRAFVYFLPIFHFLTIMPNHRVASLTLTTTTLEITRAASPSPSNTTTHRRPTLTPDATRLSSNTTNHPADPAKPPTAPAPHSTNHPTAPAPNPPTTDPSATSPSATRPANTRPPATHRYKILSSAQHGKYQWLYVEENKTVSLFIYYQSSNHEQLYLCSETPTYATLAECQKAYANIDPANQLFTHWYFETAFKQYTHYPAITTADSATTATLAQAYEQAMLAAADKSPNSHLADLYGAGTGQDILSKLLIDHHLNPSTTLDEFSAHMQQFHIELPRVPLHHSPPRRPTLTPDTTRNSAPGVNAQH